VALTARFDDALTYAAELHREQRRKGTDIPYVAHLLAVCALVLKEGGDEDEAIAALLHDAGEDQGGHETLAAVEERFGPNVAAIVAECSDTFEEPKPPWRARKEAYLAHLHEASSSALLVSLADKLDNARALLADYREHRDSLWARFNPDADQLWYYRAVVVKFREIETFDSPLEDELDRVVTALEDLAAELSSTRA
jgi:(p)ppGpp synthase/HD superfamily hydrolase